MDNLYIVILASGVGKRFGSKNPKQLIKIKGKALLYYSLKSISPLKYREVIVTYPSGYRDIFEKMLQNYNFTATLVEGGERRQDSVIRAINNINDDSAIVLIHDSARPIASSSLFLRVYKATKKYGNAIPVIPIPDTVKKVEDHLIIKTIDRDKLFLSQTPQGFKLSLLKNAINSINQDITYTDEANLLELLGEKVYVVQGERYNLKLTFKEDLDIIKNLVEFYENKSRIRS